MKKTLLATEIVGSGAASSIQTQPNGDFSLYFHVPFCTKKCSYCHFYVIPNAERHRKLYLESLRKEWDLCKHLLPNRSPISIFFGGGTPSLLDPDAICEILSWFTIKNAEVTIEVNPETVTLKKIAAYQKYGINRISMGVQSFDPSLLQKLGREHSSDCSIQAINTIKEGGIDNISIDLLFEVPGQTLSSWKRTLEVASNLPITHLSIYNLTIEPHTAFYKMRKKLQPQIPDQTTSLQMLEDAVQICENAGFYRYEISAFAKKNYHSLHNMGYWTGRPFLGFGPSAFSYWNGTRRKNISNINRWAKCLAEGRTGTDFEELLDLESQKKELIAIGLRILAGIDLTPFQPLPLDLLHALNQMSEKNYINQTGQRIQLTSKGLLFYDTVAVEII